MSFRVCHPQRPNALALSTDDVIAVMGDDSVSIVDATEVMCASPSSLRRAEVRVPWGTGSVPAPGGDDESKAPAGGDPSERSFTSLSFSPRGYGPAGSCALAIVGAKGGHVYIRDPATFGCIGDWEVAYTLFNCTEYPHMVTKLTGRDFGKPIAGEHAASAWSSSGLLAVSYEGHGIGLWMPALGCKDSEYYTINGERNVTALAWKPNSAEVEHLAVGRCNGEVSLLYVVRSPYQQAPICTVGPVDDRRVECIAWSSLSTFIAIGCASRLTLWNILDSINPNADGPKTHVISPHTLSMTSIAWTATYFPEPPVERLLSVGIDGHMHAWDPYTLLTTSAEPVVLVADIHVNRTTVGEPGLASYGLCVSPNDLYALTISADPVAYNRVSTAVKTPWRSSIKCTPLIPQESVYTSLGFLLNGVLSGFGNEAVPSLLDVARMLSISAHTPAIGGPDTTIDFIRQLIETPRDQPADMEARRLRVVCSLRTCTTAGKPIPPACDSVARSFVARIEPQLLAAVLTATIAAMADNGTPASDVEADLLLWWGVCGLDIIKLAAESGFLVQSVIDTATALAYANAKEPPTVLPCTLCAAPLLFTPASPLSAVCARDHSAILCALTLRPLEEDVRVCRVCGAGACAAVVDDAIARDDVMPSLPFPQLCTLCGGDRW